MSESLLERYRRHRKNVNENLGLIIALAASVAAIWSGYEARRARLDAADAVNKSMQVQQQSLDAQITAMSVDERPYIRVEADQVKPLTPKADDPLDDYISTFKVIAFGRTPATFIDWNISCGVTTANHVTGVALSADEASQRHLPATDATLILYDLPGTEGSGFDGLLNNEESIQIDCPFSNRDYVSNKPDFTLQQNRHQFDDKSTYITFAIDVSYRDVFDATHRTQECFYIPNGLSPVREGLKSCTSFKPLIQ